MGNYVKHFHLAANTATQPLFTSFWTKFSIFSRKRWRHRRHPTIVTIGRAARRWWKRTVYPATASHRRRRKWPLSGASRSPPRRCCTAVDEMLRSPWTRPRFSRNSTSMLTIRPTGNFCLTFVNVPVNTEKYISTDKSAVYEAISMKLEPIDSSWKALHFCFWVH